MPLRPCLHPRCPNTVVRGRCPEHAQARRQSVRDSAERAVYNDHRWQETRKRAIARAGGRCQFLENGRRCTVTRGLHGHHAYPGGVTAMLADLLDPFDDAHVVALCARHHGRVEGRSRAQNPSNRR